MALITKGQAADRAQALCEDAMRALGRRQYPNAGDFLEAARSQVAAITSSPVDARKVGETGPDPRFSSSLNIGLSILALFPTPANGDLLGIAEVATELDMARSTVHRYMSTLVLLGQLEQTVGRKYRRPEIESR